MQKTRLRAVIAIIALALVFVALPLGRILLRRGSREGPAAGPPVTVLSLGRRDMVETLGYSGVLKPESTITILPKVSGRMLNLSVREGSLVIKDQVIARIDEEVSSLQTAQAKAAWEAAQAQAEKAQRGVRPQELESARASLAQAEEDLARAQTLFERSERLYQAGSISKADYEVSEGSLASARTLLDNSRRAVSLMEEGASREDQEMAQAQAQAMRAQYDLALLQSEYSRVRAPAAGRVLKVLAFEGNMVSPAVPIAVIAQDGAVLAQIAVPERHYGRFITHRGGIPVRVRPIAFPDHETFLGEVVSVAQTVDPQSRSFQVEASVGNPGGLLRGGMFVKASMELARSPGALALPESCVLRGRDGDYAFLVEAGGGAGRALRRMVATGIRAEGWVEILSGLSAGDLVVKEGNGFLEDGQAVRVVDAE